MNNTYLGIDIGGTAVKIGIVDQTGTILCTGSCSVSFDNYETPIIKTVVSFVDSFLSENKISPDSLCGIGVSATGQIDSSQGIVAGSAGHIKNWLNTPIKSILEEHYHLPVTVANDANCAMLGELWQGAAKNCKNAIMITIGTGVGGGIIVNGQLLSGAVGIAGELGHFSVEADGIPCSCGSRGCYERYASTSALVRKVKEHPAFSQIENIDGKFIFQKLAENDPVITEIAAEWMGWIACGIVSLIHIFNPECVIIGGGVSQQQELFIKPLTALVFDKVMPYFQKNLTICSAVLGNNAGLLGAVFYFSEQQKDGN